MKTLTIELPQELSPAQERDLKMEIAGKLYSKELLSGTEAANLVGISRGEFLRQIGKYGYSIIKNYTEDDLNQDLGMLHSFFQKRDDSRHNYLDTDLINRFQNWYKINCNGDWEHSYGISISTLDNPGWSVRIELQDTALESLSFTSSHQSDSDEHDWHHISVKKQVFDMACGPSNLTAVLQLFLNEVLPTHADSTFLYDIYLPAQGLSNLVWVPAKASLVTESSMKLQEIPVINYQEIKVQHLDQFNFSVEDVSQLMVPFQVGDKVLVGLEEMFDGIKLVALAVTQVRV